MKRSKVYPLRMVLPICKTMPGLKFKHAVIRNMTRLDNEFKTLDEAIEISDPKHQAFEDERIQLAEKCADKDESGKPIIQGGAYKISDPSKFDTAFDKLKKKYPDAEKAFQERLDHRRKFLDQECEEYEPYMISIDEVPAEAEPFLEQLQIIIE